MTELYDVVCNCQNKTKNIRNICILAHVDHGKTTLVDFLCASNGIISNNMAGELRYMDSREDEQRRGITMKSSAISLLHCYEKELYLINLVDTPGHVDFSFEVAAAVRVCDGAIILVDVVEGVCSQTHGVIRLALIEGLKCVLYLNKIDKLFTHLKLSTRQACHHLRKIVEQVNSIIAQFFNSELLDSSFYISYSDSLNMESYFVPENGNVIFGSAIEGWGFTLPQFAHLIGSKIADVNSKLLSEHMWGDYYWNSKKCKFIDCSDGQRISIFEKYVLGTILNIYDVTKNRDMEKIARIYEFLKLIDKDLSRKGNLISGGQILSKWLPLFKSIFDSVLIFMPSPTELDSKRVEKFFSSGIIASEVFTDTCRMLKKEITSFNTDGHNVVAFMSKLIFIPFADLPRKYQINYDKNKLSNQLGNEFCIGFARLFCGIIRKGDSLFFLGPKHDCHLVECSDKLPNCYQHGELIVIGDLFTFMGRELISVDIVYPGNIFGFTCSGHLKFMKTATLSNFADCPPLTPYYFDAFPIMAVSVEPENIGILEFFRVSDDLNLLNQGLEMLYLSDPCVETFVSSLGEHLIKVAGQLHLDKCIEDLKNKFVRVPLTFSRPLVQFRETISHDNNEYNIQTIQITSFDSSFACKISVTLLPENIVALLIKYNALIQMMIKNQHKSCLLNDSENLNIYILKFKCLLESSIHFDSVIDVDKICGFCKSTGTNILLNCVPGLKLPTVWGTTEVNEKSIYKIFSSLLNGFELAMEAGPLCEEPLYGLCFCIKEFEFISDLLPEGSECDGMSVICRKLISGFRNACRNLIVSCDQRLVQPVFLANIRVSSTLIGKVHGVITRRSGRIVSEDIIDDLNIFLCDCFIPIINSFGFEDEIRSKTRGMASAQLKFSHWEIVQDEISDCFCSDENEDIPSFTITQKLVNEIRLRKGLITHEQIVEDPNKQRTLAKKK